MIYLLPSAGSYSAFSATEIINLPKDLIGVITTPAHGKPVRAIQEGYLWSADNEAFTKPFDANVFFPWLVQFITYQTTCLFVSVPDVVGNAQITLDQYARYSQKVYSMGFKVAFVAQDGQEDLEFPTTFDCLFVGGTNKFKLSQAAISCVRRARALGKWIHVGRVNSWDRMRYSAWLHADSVDGTHLKYERNVAINRILNWTKRTNQLLAKDIYHA